MSIVSGILFLLYITTSERMRYAYSRVRNIHFNLVLICILEDTLMKYSFVKCVIVILPSNLNVKSLFLKESPLGQFSETN